MMDGLSLVTSVITLVAGVVEVVKRVITFYRASEEVRELQPGLDLSRPILLLSDPLFRSKSNSLQMCWQGSMIGTGHILLM